MLRKKRHHRLFWDLVAAAVIAGIIYGAIQYVEFAGPWKALVVIPLMLVTGFFAASMLYPLWFRE